MRIGRPFADEVEIGPDGVRLRWRTRCAEARYCGRDIPWSRVRDADPDGYPPELRLTDGRTVFVSRERHEELGTAVDAAGVKRIQRPDIWADLLEPFLDTDYEISRERCETRLRSHGFTDAEVRRIRRRVRGLMYAMTLVTWEWGGYGQSDVLLATAWFIRRMPWLTYRRFRAWTDAIADRASATASGGGAF